MLEVKSIGQKLSVPALFKAIIENDAALRLTRSSSVVYIKAFREQRRTKQDYMRTAEKTYAGTKNKGTEI